MDDVSILCEKVRQQKNTYQGRRLFTVAISGIDASGKGHISKLLQDGLGAMGYNVANINIDSWQNPIPVRLQEKNKAENFYRNVFRWRDFFDGLIIPIQENRGIHFHTNLIRTDRDEYYPFVYDYENLDILLIEGILLFQQRYLDYYDYKIWINCSFDTAMKRAVDRNVEMLERSQLVDDYNSYYYPAQRLHFERDRPRQLADFVFNND